MNVHILASGSKGNSTIIEIENQIIMIDAGISLKQVGLRLDFHQKELTHLDGVFITHEHADHVGGLASLYKKYQMPIFLSKGTYRNLARSIVDKIDESAFHFVQFEQSIPFTDFEVIPFMTYHDALEPTGYKVIEKEKSLVYMTDTGYYPEHGFDILRNAHCYIIESNHEPDLLLDSDRPWILKRRILDDKGHLSNEDSAFLMVNLVGVNTKKIVLAHLSEECNTVDHALDAYHRIFKKNGLCTEDYQIICADQYLITEEIVI
ncbi:MAG: MBL fold metallo-hydrolase [Candidatus Izemoplasmatales bacterium]